MKTVLAFGTFDGLHPGHHYYLSEAAKLGDRLVAAVARDSHVRELKNKNPQNNEETRRRAVEELANVAEARLSDVSLGSFEIIDEVNPSMIALGHDQDALAEALENWLKEQGREIEIVRIPKYA